VELCQGLTGLPANATVFIKPNIVFWTRTARFPKWGVITTSRVVEDAVILLKERGAGRITIGEGIVTFRPKDRKTPAHAFESLGYRVLEKRYGVECVNVHDRPFESVDLGDGVTLNVNADILHSDFVVDLPVLKTHSQTVVSLGIKNLKGTLDIRSRQKCHNAAPERDLNYHVAKLFQLFPSGLVILDGIYTNARGPGFDGKIRRTNVLAASTDIFSADKVGASILGYDPSQVPHLAHVARETGRPMDLSDVKVMGESIEAVARRHEYAFPYTKDGTLPLPMKRMGIQGLSYREYDLTLCTYCSFLNAAILTGIAKAWKGVPWDDIEVLTGKIMKPSPGKRKTILLGKCIYQANKDDPRIREMIAVKGCPPSPRQIVDAFHHAGISVDSEVIEHLESMPGMFMKKYERKAEFDETFFALT
jgi:uncharacterized protein (DUF362 family)